jgi:thiamine-phosphate pyrophosphorylase
MTDARRCPDPLAVVRRLPPGSGVILRDYDHPARWDLARRLAAVCRKRRLVLLVGGDLQLARTLGAQGLHLPERLIGKFVKKDLAAGLLLTVAVHSREAMDRAAAIGADAVLLSPVFRTASHPHMKPLGLHRFSVLVRESKVPVYALGGLTNENIAELPHDERLAGYAGISIFMNRERT